MNGIPWQTALFLLDTHWWPAGHLALAHTSATENNMNKNFAINVRQYLWEVSYRKIAKKERKTMKEQTNEWMSEWMSAWIIEYMDGKINGRNKE